MVVDTSFPRPSLPVVPHLSTCAGQMEEKEGIGDSITEHDLFFLQVTILKQDNENS